MKKLITLFCLLSFNINAAEVFEQLKNQPVSMFDWGMHKIERFLDTYQIVSKEKESVFVRYSKEKDWIAIVGIVPSFQNPNKEACSSKLNDIRTLLKPSGSLGVHEFFRSKFLSVKEEADFAKKISDKVQIVIELGNLKKNGVQCEGSLNSDTINFKP